MRLADTPRMLLDVSPHYPGRVCVGVYASVNWPGLTAVALGFAIFVALVWHNAD